MHLTLLMPHAHLRFYRQQRYSLPSHHNLLKPDFFCLFVVNYLISLCLPPNHCCLPQLTSTAWRASCLDLLAGKSGSLGKLLRLTGRSRITFHAVCCVKSWLGIVTGRTVMPNTSVDLRVACYCMHNHTLHTDPTKKARKPPVASDL